MCKLLCVVVLTNGLGYISDQFLLVAKISGFCVKYSCFEYKWRRFAQFFLTKHVVLKKQFYATLNSPRCMCGLSLRLELFKSGTATTVDWQPRYSGASVSWERCVSRSRILVSFSPHVLWCVYLRKRRHELPHFLVIELQELTVKSKTSLNKLCCISVSDLLSENLDRTSL